MSPHPNEFPRRVGTRHLDSDPIPRPAHGSMTISSSRRTEQLQALEPSLACTDWPVGTLLRHDADHCRAAVDHIEFARRGAANVDDAPMAIWAAIRDAHDHRLTAAKVGNHHFRAKRQRAMSGCKTRRAGYFAACGAPAAIELGKTA